MFLKLHNTKTIKLASTAWATGCPCPSASTTASVYILSSTGWAKKNRTYLSVDNSAMVASKKVCDMSKVLERCRQKEPNLHSKSFKYSLPHLPKSSLPLKLGICLHSHVPEFIELKNSLPKSLDLNSVNYSVWGHCNR